MTGQKLGDSPNHPAGDRFAICAKETHVHIQDVLRSNVFLNKRSNILLSIRYYFFLYVFVENTTANKIYIHIGLTWHINQN